MTDQPIEKFDFASVPAPLPVQSLEALLRIEALLTQLLEVLTPPVITSSLTVPEGKPSGLTVTTPPKKKPRF